MSARSLPCAPAIGGYAGRMSTLEITAATEERPDQPNDPDPDVVPGRVPSPDPHTPATEPEEPSVIPEPAPIRRRQV